MPVALVDTSVLIARADANDPFNETATEIFEGVDHGDLPVGRVTNYLVLETLNWIHTRHWHRKAVEFQDRLTASSGFEIVHCAQKDFTRAVELFEDRETLSFGDATTVAYMQREGIEYVYSFDDDLDGVKGIKRFETADNPFA